MTGGFPMLGGLGNASNAGADTTASAPTTVRASGSANTKGSWTQLVASSGNDGVALIVQLGPNNTNILSRLSVDIGVGAAGSEIVLIPDLIYCRHDATAQLNSTTYVFPVNLPQATRIAARCQSNVTTDASAVAGNTIGAQVIILDGEFAQSSGGAGVETIGFLSGTTQGTAVTASASANVKGSYAQLVASSSSDYAGFLMAVDDGGNTTEPINMLWDIAIGGAGSEIIILPNFYWLNGGRTIPPLGGMNPSTTPFIPIRVPAGTRISARMQGDSASTAAIDLTLYGVRQ